MNEYETVQHIDLIHRRLPWKRIILLCAGLAACILYVYLTVLNRPPTTFPAHESFTISPGMSINEIGSALHTSGFIRSSLLFRIYIRGYHTDAIMQSGTYMFHEPMSMRDVVRTLTDGSAHIPLKSVTFPEGFTAYDMRTYIKDAIPDIPLEDAIAREGYLFPETYFIAPHESFGELIARMENEYEHKIAPLRPRIQSSGLTEQEVITLASIIEREANDEESMHMVAGILLNRLAEDMPLQVDAVFEYLLGKTSAELTIDDLAMDSPYNTYTNLGLPPTPIANPGLMAIEAVLNPTPSEYYYYLTGNDGNFYYAKTFEEHKRNKARYLR